MGDVLHDLPGMEPSVLDEPAARAQPSADRTGQVEPGAARLEGVLIVERRACLVVVVGDAEGFQEGIIGAVAGHRQHPVVRQVYAALRRVEQHPVGFDGGDESEQGQKRLLSKLTPRYYGTRTRLSR